MKIRCNACIMNQRTLLRKVLLFVALLNFSKFLKKYAVLR